MERLSTLVGDQQDAGAAELPVALCAEILQHVPQQDRLGLCALVCRAWASAATQAAVNLEKDVEKEHLPALQGWLAQHSGQLQTLKLFGYSWGEEMLQLQLPWDKMIRLQHLTLNGFTLQLPGEEDRPCNSPRAGSWDSSSGGNSSACAEWPELPSLRQLELSRVKLLDISSIFQLTNAPQLRSLILKSIEFTLVQFASFDAPGCKVDVQIVAQAIPYLLQRLPQLSVLELPLFPFTDAAVQQAAALQGLQELSLTQGAFEPACDLQQLPSTITRLQLSEYSPFDSPGPQDLSSLPGLLHLKLRSCTVPQTLLASVMQLQRLSLQESTLLPRYTYSDSTAGIRVLLDALTKLTCLRDLRLWDQHLDTRGTNISPQHFSALTASSQLTGLTLVPCFGSGCMPLPCGAVQHMFPPGRQMQALRHLTISTGDRDDACCLDSDDLSCVVASCPQLQRLDVGGSVQQGVDWSVLLQLPACCTQLRLGGAAFTDAAVPVLAQLAQLADLNIEWSPGFTDAGLEYLVGTNLSRLWVQGAGLSFEVTSAPFSGGPCGDPTVLLLEPDPKLGSVSQQLDVLCDFSPVLVHRRVNRHTAAAAASEHAAAAPAE